MELAFRNRLLPSLAGVAIALSGCGVYREATEPLPPTNDRWQAVATSIDRERLRHWRQAWTEALPRAQAADAAALAADPLLFDPDRALADPLPPSGAYRCRTFKLGGVGTAARDFAAYPAIDCRIAEQGALNSLDSLSGVQRPTGLIFNNTSARAVFLGTLVLGDETAPLRYGLDARRDMIGYIERIDERRWRLVFPRPQFESLLDVVEIVPAG